MELLLTIVEAPDQAAIAEPNKKFHAGGTIGRAADNSWVLPDPERIVSSKHAVLACANGAFTLTDQSTNGTFVNDDLNPLGAGNSTALRDGDLIIIGAYRIQVTLAQAAHAPPPAAQLPDGLEAVDFLDPGPAPATPPADPASASASGDDLDRWLEPQSSAPAEPWKASAPASDPLPGGLTETDPLAALDKSAGGTPGGQAQDSWALSSESGEEDPDWWKTSFSDHTPAATHAMPPVNAQPDPSLAQPDPWASAPAPPAQPAPVVPPNPDITSPQPQLVPEPAPSHARAAPAPAPTPTPAPAPASAPTPAPAPAPASAPTPAPAPAAAPQQPAAGGSDLARELGLVDLTPDKQQALIGEAAAILRESVQRLMGLLSARASIKNELRVERTMIMPTENNPLKFSPNAEAAMVAMFGNASEAFVSPSEAIKESFDDISDHQVAVLVGMKAAFDAMLSHFDPRQLERRLARLEHRSLLTSKNAKLWEQYLEHFQQLNSDKETSYQKLFGEAFAEAYELQLVKLKGLRRT